MHENFSIHQTLRALTDLAAWQRKNPAAVNLARELTASAGSRDGQLRVIVDELHRRYTYALDPLKETFGPVPFTGNWTGDVDDACVFVAVLAMTLGIRCRFVGARYDRSWTCFVSYELEDGRWRNIDPLRQLTDKVPDELMPGPIPEYLTPEK